jgi:hypothetical protein
MPMGEQNLSGHLDFGLVVEDLGFDPWATELRRSFKAHFPHTRWTRFLTANDFWNSNLRSSPMVLVTQELHAQLVHDLIDRRHLGRVLIIARHVDSELYKTLQQETRATLLTWPVSSEELIHILTRVFANEGFYIRQAPRYQTAHSAQTHVPRLDISVRTQMTQFSTHGCFLSFSGRYMEEGDLIDLQWINRQGTPYRITAVVRYTIPGHGAGTEFLSPLESLSVVDEIQSA